MRITTKRPTRVRINGRQFAVKYKPEAEMPGVLGLCYCTDSRIEIRTHQSPAEERDTLLHEVMHAVLYTQGREGGGKTEELYVRALATGMLGVLKDNPRLAAWLTDHKETK